MYDGNLKNTESAISEVSLVMMKVVSVKAGRRVVL